MAASGTYLTPQGGFPTLSSRLFHGPGGGRFGVLKGREAQPGRRRRAQLRNSRCSARVIPT